MNRLWSLALLLTTAALLAGPANAAPSARAKSTAPKTTMFKCKDERGRIYYADKPSPECVQGDVHQLSRHGLTIERRSASQPQQAESPAAAAERAANAEQRRRDKALLSTYSTEGQIEEAKHRNLALPLQALKQAETKRDRAQKELSDLHAQADGYASQRKQIRQALIEDIRAKEAQVARLTAAAEKRRLNVIQIEERFEADKQRFRELTTQQATR